MLKVLVDYPSHSDEKLMIQRVTSNEKPVLNKLLDPEKIVQARTKVSEVFVDDKIFSYVTDLVGATRNPKEFQLDKLSSLIDFGASPRANKFYQSLQSKSIS